MADATGRLRIMVVDDHRLFREGLIRLIAASPDAEVVGEAGTGAEVLELLATTAADVVLMDIAMPDLTGIEATRRIHADHPEVAVVIVTMLEDDDSLFAAMCAGARGYILKGADGEEVLRTVQAVARGEAHFGAEVARRLTGFFEYADRQGMRVVPFPDLSDREREVLDLIAEGCDNQQVARRLHISSKTVSNHISNIFAKLHLADRSQAIVLAREAGLGRRRPGSARRH